MKVYPHFSSSELSNSFLIASDSSSDAVLVDPGSFDKRLLLLIEENGLYVRWVLLTHSHPSHARGIEGLARVYDFTLYAYHERVHGLQATTVRHGDCIPCGPLEVSCIGVPGHSEDSLAYAIDDCLFTGDALMAGEIGSTMIPELRGILQRAIVHRLLSLPESCFLFPGHGPPSRIGIERRFNPHLQSEAMTPRADPPIVGA